MDIRGVDGNTPKVSGSKPGRPTEVLVRVFNFDSVGSNEANDVADV
jgi:hypothetical protein